MPADATKHFQNYARRLYRIFAHTFYAHREIFEEFEVCKIFDYTLVDQHQIEGLITDAER